MIEAYNFSQPKIEVSQSLRTHPKLVSAHIILSFKMQIYSPTMNSPKNSPRWSGSLYTVIFGLIILTISSSEQFDTSICLLAILLVSLNEALKVSTNTGSLINLVKTEGGKNWDSSEAILPINGSAFNELE